MCVNVLCQIVVFDENLLYLLSLGYCDRELEGFGCTNLTLV